MSKQLIITIISILLNVGCISAQSLITEIERDSIVAKIIRGNSCFEKLILADSVIVQGEKVISTQTKVIPLQKNTIEKCSKQVTIYKDNETNNKNLLSNEKQITKKYKRKQFGCLIKGLAIGVVAGVLLK